jgi:hypothetical protein
MMHNTKDRKGVNLQFHSFLALALYKYIGQWSESHTTAKSPKKEPTIPND